MRINPNSEASVVAVTSGRPTAPEPRLGQDQLALTTTESLNQALKQTPEVRADKLAEAKGHVQNGSYPPAVIIRKISELLAVHVDPQNKSE